MDYPFDFSEKLGYDDFMPDKLKLLFLASEIAPFAKTGGLADVARALPLALNKLDLDVRIALPFYRCVQNGGFETQTLVDSLEVPFAKTTLPAKIRETRLEGQIPVYLIEREDLYDRPNLYSNGLGDYYDNLERFSFFSHAALRLCEPLDFKPDIIHCHDWQTGLVPALLKGPYQSNPFLARAAALFTIHNIGYQGLFAPEKMLVTGLRPEEFFRLEGLEFWGQISLLKAGIVYAGLINTVSPSYADEIQTPAFGLRLEGLLRHNRQKLQGILNGVDYQVWDPTHDPHIPAGFGPGKMLGKKNCKQALIQEMGLNPRLEKRPLLAMISRFSSQKGLDLLVEILDELMTLDLGLIILGSGDLAIQQALQQAAQRHVSKMKFIIGFDDPLAHRIIAGADILLIPSRYEPCGLTQMYAMKYGTIPIGRAVGGLNDTITPFVSETGQGNGFKFVDYDSQAFLSAVCQALEFFSNQPTWQKIMENAMQADFSWERSAQKYLTLYQDLLKKTAEPPDQIKKEENLPRNTRPARRTSSPAGGKTRKG
jgi:starch synthase